ncbi:MAG: hypothetical protein JOZ82_13220, partial [Marmoricola sp.]|nr:hypothetical protein [Marmoricola sp.]
MTTDSAPSSPVDGSAQGGWWIILWGLAALAGVVVAWFAWRPASVCAGLALGGSISGFLAMFLARQRPPVDWARVATYTGLGAMSCVAVPAVAQVSGFIAAGLVLGVLGASPLGERAVRRARSATTRSGGTSASERQDPDQNPDHCSPIYAYIGRGLTGAQVAAMDTAAVCHAWRRSYRALEASR